MKTSLTPKKSIVTEDQYPGLCDPGHLPRVEWIDKTMFVVDMHYQRSTTSQRSQSNIAPVVREMDARKEAHTKGTKPNQVLFRQIVDDYQRLSASKKVMDFSQQHK